jgi:hypothetical protein
MVPGDWLGTQLHRWFPKVGERDFRGLVVNFAIFVLLNVAAVVACFWLLRVFEFNERISGLTSIAWLLGMILLLQGYPSEITDSPRRVANAIYSETNSKISKDFLCKILFCNVI